jgi:two-component system, cell cycle response regulator DivK
VARILIIEDNAPNLKLAILLVHNVGHVTLGAVDAETGLAMARRDQRDLILMDPLLPVDVAAHVGVLNLQGSSTGR